MWDTHTHTHEKLRTKEHKFAEYIVLMSCRQLRAISPNFSLVHFLLFLLCWPIENGIQLARENGNVGNCMSICTMYFTNVRWKWSLVLRQCDMCVVSFACCGAGWDSVIFIFFVLCLLSHLGESEYHSSSSSSSSICACSVNSFITILLPRRRVMSIVGCHYTFTIAVDPVSISLFKWNEIGRDWMYRNAETFVPCIISIAIIFSVLHLKKYQPHSSNVHGFLRF